MIAGTSSMGENLGTTIKFLRLIATGGTPTEANLTPSPKRGSRFTGVYELSSKYKNKLTVPATQSPSGLPGYAKMRHA